MGLSDGARIDIVRHSNAGLLSNEQLVIATQVDKDKWKDLLDNLREDFKDPEARFRLVYLIDDFPGTGTSFFRYNDKKAKWTGKLIRFRESIDAAKEAMGGGGIFTPDWELCIHHYVAAAGAAQAMAERQDNARSVLASDSWAKAVHLSFGTVLRDDLPLGSVAARDDAFIELTKTYYDPIIRTKHTDVGGVTHLGQTTRSLCCGRKPKAAIAKAWRHLRCGPCSVVGRGTLREHHDQPLREARHGVPAR
jgi:hypothetical protein